LLVRHHLQAACPKRGQRNHQRQLGNTDPGAAGFAQGQKIIAAQRAGDGQLPDAVVCIRV